MSFPPRCILSETQRIMKLYNDYIPEPPLDNRTGRRVWTAYLRPPERMPMLRIADRPISDHRWHNLQYIRTDGVSAALIRTNDRVQNADQIYHTSTASRPRKAQQAFLPSLETFASKRSRATNTCRPPRPTVRPPSDAIMGFDPGGRSTGGWFLTRHYEMPHFIRPPPDGHRTFISRGVLAKPGQIGKPHAKRHSRLRHPGLPEGLDDPSSISFKRATSAGLTKAV